MYPLFRIAVLIGMVFATSPFPDQCYWAGDANNITWEDVSMGQKFHWVASNPSTSTIWAVMDKKHSSDTGYQIATYDVETRVWHADAYQPAGSKWYALAVDSKGQPAFISEESSDLQRIHYHRG